MSEKEWKSGAVVMWCPPMGIPQVLFRDGYNEMWISEDEGQFVVMPEDSLRPLVVIDPENREQVEGLGKAFHESDHIAPWHDLHHETRDQIVDALVDALCALANPTPKPLPEPTDPAVRVVDRDGDMWARFNNMWASNEGDVWTWDEVSERGPLRIVTPDAPTPDADRPLEVGDRVRVSHGALTGHGTSSVSPDVFGEIGVIQETPRKFKSSFLVAFEGGLPGLQFVGGAYLTRIPGDVA